jgi:DNA-binding NtrC family response regulator
MTHEPSSADARTVLLFVDDDEMVLRSIARLLRGDAFEVRTALSADEALGILDGERIDVLVSDIDMPGMDGIGLVREARRRRPELVRMLLTGAPTMERALAAINEGEVHRFFVKPFDPPTFRRTMAALAARIERARRDGERAARSARADELRRWVEARFPGTTDVAEPAARVVLRSQALREALAGTPLGNLLPR